MPVVDGASPPTSDMLKEVLLSPPALRVSDIDQRHHSVSVAVGN